MQKSTNKLLFSLPLSLKCRFEYSDTELGQEPDTGMSLCPLQVINVHECYWVMDQ